MVEEQLCVSRASALDALKQNPAWAHKPNAHLETAFEEGVEEWWKGVRKASVFWQHKPLDVRRQLMRMDLQLARSLVGETKTGNGQSYKPSGLFLRSETSCEFWQTSIALPDGFA